MIRSSFVFKTLAEAAALHPKGDQLELNVHPDRYGVYHCEGPDAICLQAYAKPSTYKPLLWKKVAESACQSCHWATLEVFYEDENLGSIINFAADQAALVELRNVANKSLDTLNDCIALFAILGKVPTGDKEYESAADKIADTLDGPLYTIYMQRLLSEALKNLQAQVFSLKVQNFKLAAKAVEDAIIVARMELESSEKFFVKLRTIWPDEHLLNIAARKWHVGRGVYWVPAEVYAYCCRDQNDIEVKDYVVDPGLNSAEREALAVLFEPGGTTHSATLAGAIKVVQSLKL